MTWSNMSFAAFDGVTVAPQAMIVRGARGIEVRDAVDVPLEDRANVRHDSNDSSVFDFLRATAILLVLGDHWLLTITDVASRPVRQAAVHAGHFGVLLFFVHTSLVLMMSLARAKARGVALLAQFYVRRAFRIYPLSLVTVGLVVLWHLPSFAWRPAESWPVSVVAANLLLVQNLARVPDVLAPLWTLPLELQMYILLPLVFCAVGRGTRLRVAIGLWGVSVAIALVQPSLSDRADVAQYAPCFLGGVVAFCLTRSQSAQYPFWMWPLVLASAIAGYLAVARTQGEMEAPPWVAWMMCLGLGLIVPRFRETSSRPIREISRLTARYSYGIYLSHMILLWVAFRHVHISEPAVQGAVFAVLMVVVPVAAYHLIEAPGIRLGVRLASRLTASRAGTSCGDSLQLTPDANLLTTKTDSLDEETTGLARHRRGGGALTTAQNPPSSVIALTNSGKSTGLTTYPFTPKS